MDMIHLTLSCGTDESRYQNVINIYSDIMI